MSTNFHIHIQDPQTRVVHEEYLEKKDAVDKALSSHGVLFVSEEAKEDFLQDILNALEVNEFRIVSMLSFRYEHIGKSTGGKFILAMPLSEIESCDDDVPVEDLYGRTMSMDEFRKNVLYKKMEITTTSIGTNFC